MKRFCALLLTALLLIGGQTGCGGNKDKGINKDKDKPKPSAKALQDDPCSRYTISAAHLGPAISFHDRDPMERITYGRRFP